MKLVSAIERFVIFVLVVFSFSLLCVAQSRMVALTFDDLPAVGTENVAEIKTINQQILDELNRHHAPAIGFVIGKKIKAMAGGSGATLLDAWISHGHELGSHTFSHGDLNTLTVAEFERDLIENETVILPALPSGRRRLHYLRFPFNHTGESAVKHEAVLALLTRRGYRVARCTIDNSDYLFEQAYALMLRRNDMSSAAKLRSEYLAYTAAEIDYYSHLHRQVFGREIPQVMLFHVNRLNAELMDSLLNIFEARQYRFVTLDQAQADPAYGTPDTFATKFGPMWGYRWARERGVAVNGTLEPEPAAWITEYIKHNR